MNITRIFDQLEAQAHARGNAAALVVPGGERLSFAELWSSVQHVSAGMQRAGLAPGERVLFAVRPGPAAFVLTLAIVRAGGVVVALDLGAGPDVFRERMALIGPCWVVAESMVLAISSFGLIRTLLRRKGTELPNLAGLAGAKFVRVGPWLPGVPRAWSYRALRATPPDTRPVRIGDEDPVFMVFTSGTTAAPRVVVHSNRSIGATVALAAQHLALSTADRVYSDQFHMVLPALLAGATCIIPRFGRFSARRTLRELSHYRVTCTSAIPAEYQEILEELQRGSLKLPYRLRTVLLGAAPVQAQFLARLQEHVLPETTVWCVYGATEMLPLCRVQLADKTAYQGEGDLVGHPFPGISVRVDPSGELCVRGPNLCTGYLGASPINELHTGDLASIAKDGQVVLLGRGKDMIIRGHQNIYPALIEPMVGRIAGVRNCALIGVPNRSGTDEIVVLIVEPETGSDQRILMKRLQHEVCDGPNRIDAAARPDRIMMMPLPLSGRSRKVDKALLSSLIQERLACTSR